MRTETVKIYKYDELSDKAKEAARDWYRSGNLDYEWWDFVYEDAKTIALLFGLDIEDIYFSGFASQGDGALFVGNYSYKKGALKAVKEHAPKDTKLHDIVLGLQNTQRKYFYRLTASTTARGHYSHSGCMSVDVDINEHPNGGYWDDISQAQEDIADDLRLFADWIYEKLEAEYDYLNSDEVAEESIKSNEYEFTASGEHHG